MKSTLHLTMSSWLNKKIKVTLHQLSNVEKVTLLSPNIILNQVVTPVIMIKLRKDSIKANIGIKITLKTHQYFIIAVDLKKAQLIISKILVKFKAFSPSLNLLILQEFFTLFLLFQKTIRKKCIRNSQIHLF